jgi:hypothetical protein
MKKIIVTLAVIATAFACYAQETNQALAILPVALTEILDVADEHVTRQHVAVEAAIVRNAITNTPQTHIDSLDEMTISTTNNFHLRPGGDGLIETGDDLTIIVGAGYTPYELKADGDQSTFATKNAALYYAGTETWTRSNEVETTEGNLTIGASTAVKIIAPTTIASNLVVTGTVQAQDATASNHVPTKSQVDAGTNVLQGNINSLSNFVVGTSFDPYPVPFATSNNIALANGGWQYYAPTNTSTVYLPAAATNLGHSISIDFEPGTNSLTIATNGFCVVTLSTNPVFSIKTSGSTKAVFYKPYNSPDWRGATLP